MKDWIIKLLGGYTEDEHKAAWDLYHEKCNHLNNVFRQLEKARKNAPLRDPKTGRFVKK